MLYIWKEMMQRKDSSEVGSVPLSDKAVKLFYFIQGEPESCPATESAEIRTIL